MAHPLRLLNSRPTVKAAESLGDQLLKRVIDPGWITTLLDCFAESILPSLLSPDSKYDPLTHSNLREFLATFAVPSATMEARLGPNDRVLIALPGGPPAALALLSVMCYHTAVPVSFSCTHSQLLEYVQRLGIKAVLTTSDAEERYKTRELRSKLGIEVVYLQTRASGTAGVFDMMLMEGDGSDGSRVYRTSRLQALSDQSLVLHAAAADGTTKVVSYNARSLIISACAVIKSWDLKDIDTNMNMMPLTDAGSIICSLLAPMLSAGSVIVHSVFDADSFWRTSMESNATWFYALPSMHQAILVAKPQALLPLRDTHYRLICSAGLGLLPTLAQQLIKTFGAVVLPSYGIMECMPIASPPLEYHLERVGSSGTACGPYLSIRDPAAIDRELLPGVVGAVCVRGSPLFDGYDNTTGGNMQSCSVFSSDGWFDTGDCGHMDSDGHLFLVGRSNEIIHQGSHFISPFDVEDAIMSIMGDLIIGVTAFPVSHDVLGQTVGIAIVCPPSAPRPSLADLHARLTGTLNRSKWPFLVVYMDEAPQTPLGEPLRADLASRLHLSVQSDVIPWLHRHYEAHFQATAVAEPSFLPSFSCAQVSINLELAGQALFDLPDVVEAAVSRVADGSLQAAVYTSNRRLTAISIKTSLRHVLPGYNIPETIFVLQSPLPRTTDNIDFEAIGHIVADQSLRLSSTGLLIRGLVAGMLHKDISLINGDSDFFLLGGNPANLGQLAHIIYRDTGCHVSVIDLCINSTVNGMAATVDAKKIQSDVVPRFMKYTESQESTFSGAELYRNATSKAEDCTKSEESLFKVIALNNESQSQGQDRRQLHPLVMLVHTIPVLFFYPLQAAWIWTFSLVFLAFIADHLNIDDWTRTVAVSVSVSVAWISACMLFPITAIAFKWIIIGRYRPGRYRLYCNYHLRWWIVNCILDTSGYGFFALHPRLLSLYCRLLGARVGQNVHISRSARLAEYDLLTIADGCRIDKAHVRGFCVERQGYFALAPVILGQNVVINGDTQISPGTVVPPETVWGPHTSSHEQASPPSFRDYNRTGLPTPGLTHLLVVAYPVIVAAYLVCYVPWLAALFGLVNSTDLRVSGLNSVVSIVFWFSRPKTVGWFALVQVARVVAVPVFRLIVGIIVKRLMGIDRRAPISAAHFSNWVLMRRYINHALLSEEVLDAAFDVVGRHPSVVSFVYRAMGARVGKRVQWPATGLYCSDPELLEIHDDVIFGGDIELYTSDSVGSATITMGSGANIGRRVVLLPGTHIGRNTYIGCGVAGKRDSVYEDNSVWVLNVEGPALLTPGVLDANESTLCATPPRRIHSLLYSSLSVTLVSVGTSCAFTVFWSIPAATTAQILRLVYMHLASLDLFATSWFRPGTMYGLIASTFILIHALQSLLALGSVAAFKCMVLAGRHKKNGTVHDAELYSRRQQLYVTLSRVIRNGNSSGGVLEYITGTAYLAWFYRILGATIGKNCSIWSGGNIGSLTEPDLLSIGNQVSLDDCSFVSHCRVRDNIILKQIHIADCCAVRSGSEVSSGSIMRARSMLLEHGLLVQGTFAEADTICWGWPARQVVKKPQQTAKTFEARFEFKTDYELEKCIFAL